MSRPVGLLADDLTGALDTAARFVPLVGPIPVVPAGAPIPDGPVAIDAGTRELTASDAVARLAPLLPVLAGSVLAFKKIDSLLRGHVAAELSACLPAFDDVVLAPAFPFQGRVTRGGRQWLRAAEGWRDLGTAGAPVALRDAESDADLDRIVAEGRSYPGRVLWCGTAGLAGALVDHAPVPCPVLRGPVLGLIGSDHPVTAGQLSRAAAIPPEHARLVTIPDRIPGTRPHAAAQIAARFAQVLDQAARPGMLFVTGGETLAGICRSLGATGLRVDGEFEPGAPTSTLIGGRWDGQRVVSKSGAFGGPDLLVRLVERTRPG